jgi:hypothetical protein
LSTNWFQISKKVSCISLFQSCSHALTYLLITDEMKREKEFYRHRGLTCPKDMLVNNDEIDNRKNMDEASNDADFHRFDEQVR